jgi:hypothetical protein
VECSYGQAIEDGDLAIRIPGGESTTAPKDQMTNEFRTPQYGNPDKCH